MAIINCLFLPTSENPRGLSIGDLFANFIAQTTQLTIHKTIVVNYKNVT